MYTRTSGVLEHSNLHLTFLAVLDQLSLLLLSADMTHHITTECHTLLACKDPQTPLFSEHFIAKLISNKIPVLLNILLLPFVTWFDHSILRKLVLATQNKEAVQLLDKFDSLVDCNQPLTVPAPSQLIIPLADSDYTLVATKCDINTQQLTIKHVSDIKTTLLTQWGITEHAIQLIAIHVDYNVLYWMIPESVAPLIENHIDADQYELQKSGIIRSAILPKQSLFDQYRRDVTDTSLFSHLSVSNAYPSVSTVRRVCTLKKLHTACKLVCAYLCTIFSSLKYLTTYISNIKKYVVSRDLGDYAYHALSKM